MITPSKDDAKPEDFRMAALGFNSILLAERRRRGLITDADVARDIALAWEKVKQDMEMKRDMDSEVADG